MYAVDGEFERVLARNSPKWLYGVTLKATHTGVHAKCAERTAGAVDRTNLTGSCRRRE